VNGLVEWPKAVLCSFEREFLRVPQEALISTMESNQKFFPVINREHRLSEHFIGIANIESKDEAEVRKGYERVIRPRFADARFFFDEDCKQGLAAMAGGLSGVTYQQKLGSYADKTARVVALAVKIAGAVGVDQDQAGIAASLAKADLQSRLVGEFPELQGIAGRYYARDAGLSGEIADAIDHAYMPRYSGDAIAPSKLGQVLAIAERLDTLAGGFAAGLKPTGSKDPFALRRHALGLARTLLEGEFELDLQAELALAVRQLPAGLVANASEIHDFLLERLRGYYAERGFTGAQFDAVAAVQPASLRDFDRRLRALAEFAGLVEAESLAAANKRIRNILRKVEGGIPAQVDAGLLKETAERDLAAAVAAAIADTDPMLAARDYVGVLRRLAALRVPVDAFFDGVMVMDEDPAVRGNRLALLKRLADRFAAVAEVALLA
jgi:glycyl-tRNA synthetase beta chain